MTKDKHKRRGRPQKDLSPVTSQDFTQTKKARKKKRGRPRKKTISDDSTKLIQKGEKLILPPKQRPGQKLIPKLTEDQQKIFDEELEREYIIQSANKSEISEAIHTVAVELENKVYDSLIKFRIQLAHKNTPLGKFVRLIIIWLIEKETGFVPGTFDTEIAEQLYPEIYGSPQTDEEIDAAIDAEMAEREKSNIKI